MNRSFEPPDVLGVADADAGLTGWLAVDSLVDGHFCGGLRMLPDVSASELAALARAMTLKHGFLGIPHGGAKAGILCSEDASEEKRAQLLAAFGRKVEDLLVSRTYLPGSDMGTSTRDIRDMLGNLGIRVPRRALRGQESGWYTSLTVIAAATAASAARGFDLREATVAIEGFGDVGGAVARGLDEMGSKIVAVSTRRGALHSQHGLDVEDLRRASREHGSAFVDHYQDARKIDRESLLELDVDVLVPCARHHSIHADNVDKIKAATISCGANVPATEEAERLLAERGILCIPDFVANAGGVLGGTMEFAGIRPSSIVSFVNTHFSRQVSLVIDRARQEGAYIRDVAEGIAMERFTRMRDASGNRSLRKRAFSFAMELYRNGMIPSLCVGAMARPYFQRRIEGVFE
jgi:glutamate dehydrogenase (NAD(P)+)